MRFLSKDQSFYDLLVAQADAAHRAALEFQALVGDMPNAQAHVSRIREIEHEADDLTHQLANRLDATFVTPLDKEDLRALSGGLDDITDFIEAGTQRVVLYRLTEARSDLAPLVGMLVSITEATREAVAALRNRHGRDAFRHLFIKVHDIENEADLAFRRALAELFNAPGADPLMVLKWKEVYDRIEVAVDKCEDVANAVESVVVKYA